MLPGLSFAIIASIGAMALAGPAAAQASRVGVTSATDGDPLGKPPADSERVLRIGIDVQANEVVTTHDKDRAHLVFLDGTALTVGPNAQLTIDKFVYDPNSKTGDLAITASKGLFRLVGGKISKTNTINIATPSGTIGIRGGITIFSVTPGSTTANFIFGHHMTVTGGGQTQNVTRQGSQVIVNSGTPPSLPSLLPPGGLSAAISSLETGTASGGGGPTGNSDQRTQTSGFSGTNTGAPPGAPPPPSGNPPNTNNPNITNAIAPGSPGTPTPDAPTPVAVVLATPKTSQTLQGFVGGLVVTSSGGSTSTTSLPSSQDAKPGDLTITTNATSSTAQATVIIRNIDGTVTSPTVTLPIGTTSGSSFFQDNATFRIGADPGTATLKPVIGGPQLVSQSTLLTSSAATPSSAAPFVGPGTCSCDFLTFGEWQTTITDSRTATTRVVTQAPWVAGTVAVQLPNTGSASFAGIMLGQVQNGATPIQNIQGSYGMNYSWGAGTGNFNASFDSRNYTGTVTGSGASSFTGSFAGGGNSGALSGVFNSAPGAVAGSAPAGQSGTFGISGPNYLASGVFAGSRR